MSEEHVERVRGFQCDEYLDRAQAIAAARLAPSSVVGQKL
jgi:hypothetical protein